VQHFAGAISPLCNSGATSLSEGGLPYPRRNFTSIPIRRIDAFMPPPIRGGPPYCRRGRNFTTVPIRGIDAFMPPPIRGGPPCCRSGRNFTTIPIRGIGAFMPPPIRGGPLCCRRGRNFTTILICGIDAFMPPPSHRRLCSRMELYLLSKFASALEKLKYQRINLRRICKLLIMHV
jgi:hypothetical protein